DRERADRSRVAALTRGDLGPRLEVPELDQVVLARHEREPPVRRDVDRRYLEPSPGAAAFAQLLELLRRRHVPEPDRLGPAPREGPLAVAQEPALHDRPAVALDRLDLAARDVDLHELIPAAAADEHRRSVGRDRDRAHVHSARDAPELLPRERLPDP